MSNRKKLLISIFSLALCVLVTFAWINELQNPEGRVLALRIPEASAASSDLQVKLWVNVVDEEYDDITKPSDDDETPQLESYENFAPGERMKFKVDVVNVSNAPVTIRVILSDIICEDEELRDSIIIGTNGFDGFNATYPAPLVQNQRLSDGMSASGSFTLVESVQVPPANAEEPISIYFYVMFSATGTEHLEDTSFSIGTINFLTL